MIIFKLKIDIAADMGYSDLGQSSHYILLISISTTRVKILEGVLHPPNKTIYLK